VPISKLKISEKYLLVLACSTETYIVRLNLNQLVLINTTKKGKEREIGGLSRILKIILAFNHKL